MKTTLPLYVIHEGKDAFSNDGLLRTHLCTLLQDLSDEFRGSAVLDLRLFEVGRSLPSSDNPRVFSDRVGSPDAYQVELGAVFQRIAAELDGRADQNPEVLLFLRTFPSADSREAWEKLICGRVVVATYCCPWPELEGDEKQRLKELLAEVERFSQGRAPYRIVPPEEWDQPELFSDIFAKLQDRIRNRRAPGAQELPCTPDPPSAGSPSETEMKGKTQMHQTARQGTANPPIAHWEMREPSEDLSDRRGHEQCEEKPTIDGWSLIGASVRGKLHAHEGTFREDAFALGFVNGWNLVAVADGAGSHPLSRVGSDLAVKAAVGEMEQRLGTEPESSLAESTLQEALKAAWRKLRKEAAERERPFEDFGTTLLLLAYHIETGLLGVAQIGDGLLAVQLEGGEIKLLGSPQTGEYSGQTSFLTNYMEGDLAARVEAVRLEQAPLLFLVMTDGVADDLYPPEQKLAGLIRPLPEMMTHDDRPRALLELISYDLSGSFDDRTLVMVCRPLEQGHGSSPSPETREREAAHPAGAEPFTTPED